MDFVKIKRKAFIRKNAFAKNVGYFVTLPSFFQKLAILFRRVRGMEIIEKYLSAYSRQILPAYYAPQNQNLRYAFFR